MGNWKWKDTAWLIALIIIFLFSLIKWGIGISIIIVGVIATILARKNNKDKTLKTQDS